MTDFDHLIQGVQPEGELAKRVNAVDDLPDTFVCWRCLVVEVTLPGDTCGEEDHCTIVDKQRKSSRPLTGPSSTYDPTRRPPVSELTEEERLAEIRLLAVTQSRDKIPGGAWYRKIVQGIGLTFYDLKDLRRADREYQRGSLPSNRSHHDDEVVPGA